MPCLSLFVSNKAIMVETCHLGKIMALKGQNFLDKWPFIKRTKVCSKLVCCSKYQCDIIGIKHSEWPDVWLPPMITNDNENVTH